MSALRTLNLGSGNEPRSGAVNLDLRRDLSARGLENARRFSWRRASAETMAVCEAAAVA